MKKQSSNNQESKGMSYKIFATMMLISFIIMYGVMFLNVADTDHIYLSLTRTYMTLLMVSPMAVFMLLMMGKMYPNKKLNTIIIIGSALTFGLIVVALRTQTPISDVQYMKAMIPHHSSAILTSENANIKDPELRQLADEIIKAQKNEITEMKAMLERLEKVSKQK